MARLPMHTAVEATHDGLNASNHSPLMMMPVPHPTGPDGRRSSAPAVPVRVGVPAVPLQSPTVPLSDMRVHTAPPIPQRPGRPYIAPKPHTMPEMAIRLRAQSFASRAELDRPLPPLPRTRTESIDSQAMSLSDMDNPTDLTTLSEDGESSDQTPPKPVTKLFLREFSTTFSSVVNNTAFRVHIPPHSCFVAYTKRFVLAHFTFPRPSSPPCNYLPAASSFCIPNHDTELRGAAATSVRVGNQSH